MSTKIQDERFELMEAIVTAFDKNKSGNIYIRDCDNIFKALGRPLVPEESEKFVNLIDPKMEGKVPISKFMEGLTTIFSMPQDFIEEVKDAFDVFDTNNDGKITVNEFKKILLKHGDYEEKFIDQTFQKMDLDKNGEIAFNEFVDSWNFY